jgi:hypothetical protein
MEDLPQDSVTVFVTLPPFFKPMLGHKNWHHMFLNPKQQLQEIKFIWISKQHNPSMWDLGPMLWFFKNIFAEKLGENIGVFFTQTTASFC